MEIKEFEKLLKDGFEGVTIYCVISDKVTEVKLLNGGIRMEDGLIVTSVLGTPVLKQAKSVQSPVPDHWFAMPLSSLHLTKLGALKDLASNLDCKIVDNTVTLATVKKEINEIEKQTTE